MLLALKFSVLVGLKVSDNRGSCLTVLLAVVYLHEVLAVEWVGKDLNVCFCHFFVGEGSWQLGVSIEVHWCCKFFILVCDRAWSDVNGCASVRWMSRHGVWRLYCPCEGRLSVWVSSLYSNMAGFYCVRKSCLYHVCHLYGVFEEKNRWGWAGVERRLFSE
jgi:hypothetical protein